MTSLAMNSGYRFESMQSSGMRHLASYPTGRYVSLAKASILRMTPTKSLQDREATMAECFGSPDSWNNCIGTQTLTSGGKYAGEFKEGKRNGKGTYTWPDGQKYVGEFKDNKRNGQGINNLADGTKYVGEWKDDKPESVSWSLRW